MKTFVGHLLAASFASIVIVGAGPDSTLTSLPGYGGVLPLPLVIDELAPAGRLDVTRIYVSRGTRGRVLYATARPPRNVEPARASRPKRLCSETVVQGRRSATPHS